MNSMEKTADMRYDYIVSTLVQGEKKGTKVMWGIELVKTLERGAAEKENGGPKEGGCVVFDAVRKMLTTEYKNDSCIVLFNMTYVLEGNRRIDKLVLIVW